MQGRLGSVRPALEAYSTAHHPLEADDVSLTSGCSHALQIAIEVLCNPGDTLLIPNPAFPLYETIADHLVRAPSPPASPPRTVCRPWLKGRRVRRA